MDQFIYSFNRYILFFIYLVKGVDVLFVVCIALDKGGIDNNFLDTIFFAVIRQ